MITLSKEQVIRLHDVLMARTGGTAGIRDESMIESALAAPFQTFDGRELYPSDFDRRPTCGLATWQTCHET